MVDILHKVGIKSSSLDDVYKALTTLEGLSAWWTTRHAGESKVGGVLQFRFGAGGFDMKVLELRSRQARAVAGGRGARRMDRHNDKLRLKQKATGPSSSSNTRAGRSRWSSCTIAAPSGGLSAEPEVASRNR
jgi:hypothetical protein